MVHILRKVASPVCVTTPTEMFRNPLALASDAGLSAAVSLRQNYAPLVGTVLLAGKGFAAAPPPRCLCQVLQCEPRDNRRSFYQTFSSASFFSIRVRRAGPHGDSGRAAR